MKKIFFAKKSHKIFCITTLLCLIVLWVFSPYIKAEYLTHKHGDEFIGLECQTGMLCDSRYLKVFDYSPSRATVFYVSGSGDLITFVKEQGVWIMDEWKTIWSFSGSADDFIWPFYC